MSADNLPIWERAPWWVAVILGFLLSVGGQWAINDMVGIITLGKAHLTHAQQGVLAAGTVLVAAGTALIGKGTPERPQGMDKWEARLWGPVTVLLSAMVLLMSLICVWIIPESIKVYRESAGSDKPLAAVLATVVTLVALAISLAVIRYLRRSAGGNRVSTVVMQGHAPTHALDADQEGRNNATSALIWAVALLFVALIAPSRTGDPKSGGRACQQHGQKPSASARRATRPMRGQ